MLAHIPLTRINNLAHVLTFTSSSSSHINHYNHCIYSSASHYCLPCACPSKCLHQLPLSQPFSDSLLSLWGAYLHYQWQPPWSLSRSPPQHIKFHPSLQLRLLNGGLLKLGLVALNTRVVAPRAGGTEYEISLLPTCSASATVWVEGNRFTVRVLSERPQDQACSVFKFIPNYYPVHHNLQLKNMFLKANNTKQHHHPKKHRRVKYRWQIPPNISHTKANIPEVQTQQWTLLLKTKQLVIISNEQT